MNKVNPKTEIRLATLAEATIVGELAYKMESELWPDALDSLKEADFVRAAHLLLQPHTGLWAFLAIAESRQHIGVLTLNKCAAIYAGGFFGEIADLYVSPSWRSTGIGKRLVDAAVAFSRNRCWPFLEVGAPSLPRWQRTFDFYKRLGFKEIGPRLELRL